MPPGSISVNLFYKQLNPIVKVEETEVTTQDIALADVPHDMVRLIPYNTGMPTLKMAEYGRNIQNLVDFCTGIPDREDRTRCAHAIAEIMTILFPALKKDPNSGKKIWDHINIMSEFRLDIDFPVEVVTAEEANPVPEAIPYSNARDICFRYYGKHIQNMVKTVADMEPSEEKDTLIGVIANHMKKLMLAHNKEAVSDHKVLRDLCFLSDGKIDFLPGDIQLYDYQELEPAGVQKGNKKKK